MQNFSRTHVATILGAALLALGTTAVSAQGRATAITNARIVTMEGKVIPMGMIVIRNGKIREVGAKVKVPPGALIVDAKGGTVMPGLVSAYSRAGLDRRAAPTQTVNPFGRGRRGRPRFGGSSRSSGPGRNSAATKVANAIYPRQKIFHELLEAGVTTVALAPTGSGFPGQGALLDLTGKTRGDLIEDDTAFLAVNPSNSTSAKKLLRETFDKAKKLVEERKKPKTPPSKTTTPKKPAKKPATKPATTKGPKPTGKPPQPKPKPGPTPPKPKPKPTPTPAPKPGQSPPKPATKPGTKTAAKAPAKKKDPNLEVLADLLEGKRRSFLAINTATDLLHYLDAVGTTRFNTTILARRSSPTSGTFDQVIDKVKSLKAPILMAPKLSTVPYTDHVTNPALTLHKAGLEVGFVFGDSKAATVQLFHELIDLVRHGLDPDVALAGVTLVPARMLGLDDKVGSIKAGKDANLILFSADPLDATATVQKVFFRGKVVEKEK